MDWGKQFAGMKRHTVFSVGLCKGGECSVANEPRLPCGAEAGANKPKRNGMQQGCLHPAASTWEINSQCLFILAPPHPPFRHLLQRRREKEQFHKGWWGAAAKRVGVRWEKTRLPIPENISVVYCAWGYFSGSGYGIGYFT